mgnify:CR=1 FL=1
MKPNKEWVDDWRIGANQSLEDNISQELLSIFSDFWKEQGLNEKSKSTINRYGAALHALGGYLVEEAVNEHGSDMSGLDLLKEYLEPDMGPLIHADNEAWQREVDTVSKKLYKYLQTKR